MEAILDTNFIISCLRRRIDFLSELEKQGFKIVIPKEVFQELKDLRKKGKSQEKKIAVDIALELLSNKKIKKISLGEGYVDEGLIKKGKEGVYIATLDKGIQRSIPNKIIIKSSTNSIDIVRD